MSNVNFEIKEHVGIISVIGGRDERWFKEVNVVSWNGQEPKVDIRDWSEDYNRMSRGITLTEEEAIQLFHILEERYGEE